MGYFGPKLQCVLQLFNFTTGAHCYFVLVSSEVTSFEKITLIDEDEIIGNDSDTAHVLNTFLSNIVSNMKIPEYNKCDPLSNFISDLVLKSILKFKIFKNRKSS